MSNTPQPQYVGRKELNTLKKLYAKAIAADTKTDQFEWMGQPMLTPYAKYMIEYLELKINNKIT